MKKPNTKLPPALLDDNTNANNNNSQLQQPRTIQVKIGNQAAKEMTPDQAADYLKLIAAATSGGKRGGGGAQVKMTFQNHGSGTGSGTTTTTTTSGSLLEFAGGSGGGGMMMCAATAPANVAALAESMGGTSSPLGMNNSGNSSNTNGTTTTTTTTITWGSGNGPGGTATLSSSSSIQNSNTTNTNNATATAGNNTGGKKKQSSLKSKGIDTSSPSAFFSSLKQQHMLSSSGNNSQNGNGNNNNGNNNNNTGNTNNNHRRGPSKTKNHSRNNNGNNNNNNMPCTEKEMKALMSMFVEIMGLQMNTEKLNQNKPLPRAPVAGAEQLYAKDCAARAQTLWHAPGADCDQASPAELLAALELGPGPYNEDNHAKDHGNNNNDSQHLKAAAKTGKQSKGPVSSAGTTREFVNGVQVDELDQDEENAIPVLDDIPLRSRQQRLQQQQELLEPGSELPLHPLFMSKSSTGATATTTLYELQEHPRSGIVCGIAVPEWETLERQAMEDALEQEERARKACTAAKRKVWRPLSGTARALDNDAFLEYGAAAAAEGKLGGSVPPPNFPFFSSPSSVMNSMGFGTTTTTTTTTTGGSPPGGMNLNGLGGGPTPSPDQESRNEAAKAASLSASNMKQHAKLCTAWRNKVVGACQSNDVAGLTAILEIDECPLKGTDKEAHWIPLIPYVFPKQRLPLCPKTSSGKQKSPENSTRSILLQFLLEMVDPFWFLEPDSRSGRSGLHTACWLGDDVTVKAILDAARVVMDEDCKPPPEEESTKKGKKGGKKKKKQNNAPKKNVKRQALPNLDDPCDESGWPPLMYAALAGSVRCVELLLGEGALLSEAKTSDFHTWLKQTSKPVGLIQFLQFVSSSSGKKGIFSHVESHGMALQELQDDMLSVDSEPLKKQYLAAWKIIMERLEKCPTSGAGQISSLSENKILEHERAIQAAGRTASETAEGETVSLSSTKQSNKSLGASDNAAAAADGSSNKKQALQKNKKNKNKLNAPEKASSGAAQKVNEKVLPKTIETDPLTLMMIDMGFEREPVIQAIKALGGTNTATPDTVIAWMLDNPQDTAPQPEQKKPESAIRRQADEPQKNEPRQPNRAQPPKHQIGKKSSPQQQQQQQLSRLPSNSASNRAEASATSEKRRQQEEQRLLANKREEQRRRNREWNKKQEEAALASGTSNTTPPPLVGGTSNSNSNPVLVGGLANNNPNRPAQKKAPPPPPQSFPPIPPPQPPVSNANIQSPPAVVSANMGSNFNDISTVASSDVFDDATIATIESRISTNVQQPTLLQGFPLKETSAVSSSPAAAPPGFSLSSTAGLGTTVAAPAAPILIGDTPLPMMDMQNSGGNFAPGARLSTPASASAGIRPPGIPESHALVSDNSHLQRAVSDLAPPQCSQQVFPTTNSASNGFSGIGMGLQHGLGLGGVPGNGTQQTPPSLHAHGQLPSAQVQHQHLHRPSSGQPDQYMSPSSLLPPDSLFRDTGDPVSSGLLGMQQIPTDSLTPSSLNPSSSLGNSPAAGGASQLATPAESSFLGGTSLESSLFGVTGDALAPSISPVGLGQVGQEGMRTSSIPPVGGHGFQQERSNHRQSAPNGSMMGLTNTAGFAEPPSLHHSLSAGSNPPTPALDGGASLWGNNPSPPLGSGSDPASSSFLFGSTPSDHALSAANSAVGPNNEYPSTAAGSLLLGSSIPPVHPSSINDNDRSGSGMWGDLGNVQSSHHGDSNNNSNNMPPPNTTQSTNPPTTTHHSSIW